MDNYRMIAISNNQKTDITEFVGEFSWGDSIDTLGMKLSFSVVQNHRDKFLNQMKRLDLGDGIVLLNNNKERFQGVIVSDDIGEFDRSFTCFDFAFWLNKSTLIKQFNKVSSEKAIKSMCEELKIPVEVKGMKGTINKIYKDKVVSDIIKDIIDEAEKNSGQKFRMEMRGGKLIIEPYANLIVRAEYQLSENTGKFDATLTIGSISKSRSIGNMINSVVITSSDEKSTRVVAKAESKENIKRFGLLQSVESVDDKDKAKAQNIAKNKLKELNRIEEDISMEVLGSDELRAGRILELNNQEYELRGKFLIKDCEHSYKNGVHRCNINVERMR